MLENKWSVAVVTLMMGFALMKFSAIIDEMTDGIHNRTLVVTPTPVSRFAEDLTDSIDRDLIGNIR